MAAGQFHIYPVATIDQGIELLTGRPAGARGTDGKFPAGSINGLIESKLALFLRKTREAGSEIERRRQRPSAREDRNRP